MQSYVAQVAICQLVTTQNYRSADPRHRVETLANVLPVALLDLPSDTRLTLQPTLGTKLPQTLLLTFTDHTDHTEDTPPPTLG